MIKSIPRFIKLVILRFSFSSRTARDNTAFLWIKYCRFIETRYKFKNAKSDANSQLNQWVLLSIAILTFLILSMPYWMLAPDTPRSTSDDVSNTLQTYLSALRQGNDPINWTNGLLGGMDRLLLPNSMPYCLGAIYASFLQPYQLYLLVIGINVILVFVFTWKLCAEILNMRIWTSCIATLITVITEGYWVGTFSEAHVSNGHGFAIIIAGVYWLTRFHNHSKFWMVAVLVGMALAIGSWTPFHNLPVLLITITIWGLGFWTPNAWRKIILANVLIVLSLVFLVFPQIMVIILNYSDLARSQMFSPTVNLSKIYSWPILISLGSIFIATLLINIFKDSRYKPEKKILWTFLGFCSVPLIAYVLQASKIFQTFRWHLLYIGNTFWLVVIIFFLVDRIYLNLKGCLKPIANGFRFLVVLTSSLLIIFLWLNSIWYDLDSTYPSSGWKSLTDTSLSSMMRNYDSKISRVVGIGVTNDTHFWGQNQNMESMLGYTPLIDKRKTYFWWFSAMYPTLYQNKYDSGFLSIPALDEGKHFMHLERALPLPFLINPNALKLVNVRWIVSHHPVNEYPDLKLFNKEPGENDPCPHISPKLSNFDFRALQNYWQSVNCIFKNFHYSRPLYVYYLENSLPRAYIASQIIYWRKERTHVLTQDQLALASQGTAFIEIQHWRQYLNKSKPQEITIDDYQNDYMRLRINATSESFVVIASTLNKFWYVLIDGQPAELIDVNGFQNGFWVPSNSQTAELTYCPSFRLKEHPYCRNVRKIYKDIKTKPH